MPVTDLSYDGVTDRQMHEHVEATFIRSEKCDRLGLGRNIKKLPKDVRYCNNHPLETIQDKVT